MSLALFQGWYSITDLGSAFRMLIRNGVVVVVVVVQSVIPSVTETILVLLCDSENSLYC